MSDLPTVYEIERYGRFLGYDQYDPVFLFDKTRYVLLDSLNKGKLSYKVYRWYGNLQTLVKGYSEFDGEPISRIINDDNPEVDFHYTRGLKDVR